ncbi:MAG: NAD(P)H-dependent oxidoreductase, partial [Eggerthellaceae bacterium]|nr:NAD(P)H-dependent oxidoreductase [Eggerthellaceae bacterium]
MPAEYTPAAAPRFRGRIPMKVLIVNGSPRRQGNTSAALAEMETVFAQEGIEVETVQIGTKKIRGCI